MADPQPVFPAHAGVIPKSPGGSATEIRLPRACGGDPVPKLVGRQSGASSPRMRG